jgi:aminopeptidase N
VLTRASDTLASSALRSEPVPSLLRGFSAPVVLDYAYTDAQLLTLLAHDSDPFNRWEAGPAPGRAPRYCNSHEGADASGAGPWRAGRCLHRRDARCCAPQLDAAFKELVLTLPSETYMAEQLDVVDPQRIHAVREAMRLQLATACRADWECRLRSHQRHRRLHARCRCLRPPRPGRPGPHAPVPGRRASGDTVWPGKTLQRFKDAGNMTDRFNALAALVSSGHPLAARALQRFHAMFKDEALVIDKWFACRPARPTAAATSCRPSSS